MAKTPEPIRDHLINGVPGPLTADEAAAWWAAHPDGQEPAPTPEAEAASEPQE